MGFLAEALWLMKMNQPTSAAKLLESHINDQTLKPSAKIDLMSWIGECHLKAEDRLSAGKWFELAGRAALECKDMSQFAKQKRALHEFELAMSHYQAASDIDGISRLAALKYSLNQGNN